MSERWFDNAVIYQVPVEGFYDSDGDGIGDLRGLTQKLPYLSSLGVNCLWLLPFYPSPRRDYGYDVASLYGVDERFGDLGDLTTFINASHQAGLRLIFDLSVQHVSTDHPWWQAAGDRSSPFHDFFIWSDELPPRDEWPLQIVFAAGDEQPWTLDERSGRWYRHRFYAHEPDLNVANPAVRDEIEKVVAFWLGLGADGLRVDAAPYLARDAAPAFGGDESGFLVWLRGVVSSIKPDAVLIGEADVTPEEADRFFADGRGLHLLLNFYVANYAFLALARGDAEPVRRALGRLPEVVGGGWANFLRNHDELDLERLAAGEREEVYRALAPEKRMQIFGRGIRRRLAPMLGDERRVEMALALLFSLPGSPTILYGDEIGMGDDLDLPDRSTVRTPMQWSDARNAGFSSASAHDLVAPVVSEEPFDYRTVNVAAAEQDQGSLLQRFVRLVRARRQCPHLGAGRPSLPDCDEPSVFAVRYEYGSEIVVALCNLAPEAVKVTVDGVSPDRPVELLANREYPPAFPAVELDGWGYRWFRYDAPPDQR